MLVLWDRGSVPVRELGRALQLDYGTLTPLLKRLEAHGLLTRERRADDERSVLITLTEQGAALQAKARAVPGFIGNAMDLDAAEFEQLRASLRRLTGNVTRAADAASD
ncbi:MAG TPA: MarR family transcriptional regulator [Trebonia sp.]|nr:MarR family transcriptional regulator [Trebonia sp.]